MRERQCSRNLNKKNPKKKVTKIERNKPIAKNNGDGDATKKSTTVIQ